MTLPCRNCQGEALVNDEPCTACDGSGTQKCDSRGCKMKAIGFNDNAEALCEDCLSEWHDFDADDGECMYVKTWGLP